MENTDNKRSRKGRKQTFIRIMALLLVIAMLAGTAFYLIVMITADSGYSSYAVYAADEYERLDNLEILIEEIKDNYKDKVSTEELIDAAYQGIFDSLDNWSEYYKTEEEANELPNYLASENYGGIGISFTSHEDGIRVASVNINGPAQAAGIKYGDIITHADGKSLKSMALDDISSLIRGTVGTKVKLTINRGSEKFNISVSRAQVASSDVTYYMIDSTTAYIGLSLCGENADKDFIAARKYLLKEGMEALILDLRDNTGGYLEVGLAIADSLLKNGDIITTYKQQGKTVARIMAEGSSEKAVPLAVLVNKNTASAAELLAGSLKYYGNKLVGTKTYGKGCAQAIMQLDEDYYKLSLYYFTMPDGASIDGIGIEPDYEVQLDTGLGTAGIAEANSSVIPLSLTERCLNKGERSLNVAAAQQRLKMMGYERVKVTSVLDDATMNALKDIQEKAGGYPYGALDYFTLKALAADYESYLNGSSEDTQLLKALEILK